MTKRILAALLALMLSASTLIACSGDTTDPDSTGGDGTTASTTTVEETTTADPRSIDELPTDKKFDGRTFMLMDRAYGEASIAWLVVDIVAEEENGERINDAVYARNRMMSERFDVKVEANLVSNPYDEIIKLISAGDQTVDVNLNVVTNQGSLALGGYVLDMAQLDYLNFEKIWWDTSATKGLSLGGRVYTTFGSGQLNAYKGTWATLFNKELAADAQLPDLYKVVRDGDWTLDNMLTYCQKIARDVNGDGKMEWGVDVFGVGLEDAVNIPLMIGTGERLTTFKDDGTYTIGLDSTRMVDAAEKIWNYLHSDNNAILNVQTTGASDLWNGFRKNFAEDRFGFMLTHLGTPTLINGMMESDFGILPFPKVYEDQDEYYSTIQFQSAHSLVIPKSVKNPNETALLLEGYQMLAHDTVREAYYDYTLTLRAARDNESSEMLDIIFGNRVMDLARLFDGTTKIQSTLNSIFSNSASFTYASTIAEKKAAFKTAMDTVVETILEKE